MLPFAMVFCNSFLRLPVIVFLLIFFICEIFSQFLEIWLLGLFEPICLFQNRDLSLIHRYFSISPSMITPLQLFGLEKLWAKNFRIFLSVSNSFISGVFCMRDHLGRWGTNCSFCQLKWNFEIQPVSCVFVSEVQVFVLVPVTLQV